MNDTCNKCKWFKKYKDKRSKGGHCFLNPPAPGQDRPWVERNNFCSRFETKHIPPARSPYEDAVR